MYGGDHSAPAVVLGGASRLTCRTDCWSAPPGGDRSYALPSDELFSRGRTGASSKTAGTTRAIAKIAPSDGQRIAVSV
jgi:hypothetical protein